MGDLFYVRCPKFGPIEKKRETQQEQEQNRTEQNKGEIRERSNLDVLGQVGKRTQTLTSFPCVAESSVRVDRLLVVAGAKMEGAALV